MLAQYLCQQRLLLADTVLIMVAAEAHMAEREYDVVSSKVLTLAQASGCTSYDCEFVVLAQELGVPLIAVDRQLLARFPVVARSPEVFLAQ